LSGVRATVAAGLFADLLPVGVHDVNKPQFYINFFFTKKHHVHERYLAPLLVLLYIHNPNKSVGLMFVIEVQAGGVNKTISKELNLILQIVDF
jgi:hypothetical protein